MIPVLLSTQSGRIDILVTTIIALVVGFFCLKILIEVVKIAFLFVIFPLIMAFRHPLRFLMVFLAAFLVISGGLWFLSVDRSTYSWAAVAAFVVATGIAAFLAIGESIR